MTQAFSRIEASQSAAKIRVADAFKNEAGAFDLPSILVGVVVVGVLTAGVLASIFGVIPFSQDKAAQQNLGAVTTAQGVYKAQGTSTIAPGTTFSATLAALQATGVDLIGDDVTNVLVDGNATTFWTVTKSDTGKYFGSSSAKSTPVEVTGAVDGADTNSTVDLAEVMTAFKAMP